MNAKRYLNQLQHLDSKINNKIEQLNDLKFTLNCIGNLSYSQDYIQSNHSKDAPFTKLINRIVDLEKEINTEIDTYVNKKNIIINQIYQLRNDSHIKILFKRYVEFKDLKQISKEINYTYQYTRRLHGQALEEFKRSYTKLHKATNRCDIMIM